MPYTVWVRDIGRIDSDSDGPPRFDDVTGVLTFPKNVSRRDAKTLVIPYGSLIGFREDGLAESARIEFRNERGQTWFEGISVGKWAVKDLGGRPFIYFERLVGQSQDYPGAVFAMEFVDALRGPD